MIGCAGEGQGQSTIERIWRKNLLLLFIKPQTAGHHQLRGLKNIFKAFFIITTMYRAIGRID
jgi:hypothetical protein